MQLQPVQPNVLPSRASGSTPAASAEPQDRLESRMSGLGVTWMAHRKIPLPFANPTPEVSPSEAAELVPSGRLLVQTSPRTTALPVLDQEDVRELEALHGPQDPGTLAHPELATALKGLQARQLTFTVSGFPVDAYGAYNYATTGWPSADRDAAPVTVRKGQLPVLTLQKGKLPDLEALEKNLNRVASLTDPMETLTYLSEFHQNNSQAIQHDLARLGDPFRALREAHAVGGTKALQEVAATPRVGTLEERLADLTACGLLQDQWREPELRKHAGAALDALRRAGRSLEQARTELTETFGALPGYYSGKSTACQELAGLA
ncbi:MAG: hypothetical protein AB1758_11020, partial [Candidatus Eremiobacterota bacterium]